MGRGHASLGLTLALLTACGDSDLHTLERGHGGHELMDWPAERKPVAEQSDIMGGLAWGFSWVPLQYWDVSVSAPRLRSGLEGTDSVWPCYHGYPHKGRRSVISCLSTDGGSWSIDLDQGENRYHDLPPAECIFCPDPIAPLFPPFVEHSEISPERWPFAWPVLPLHDESAAKRYGSVTQRSVPEDPEGKRWTVTIVDETEGTYLGAHYLDRRMTMLWDHRRPWWDSAVLQIRFAPGENPFEGKGDLAEIRSTAANWIVEP